MPELEWTKSSFSEASGNNCVEVAHLGDRIALRESEDPAHVLALAPGALAALLRSAKAGALHRSR